MSRQKFGILLYARLQAIDPGWKVNARYSIDMDFESVPILCERHALTFPDP